MYLNLFKKFFYVFRLTLIRSNNTSEISKWSPINQIQGKLVTYCNNYCNSIQSTKKLLTVTTDSKLSF